MKFIHMADMHFDAPFITLNGRERLGEKRRLDQRAILKKIIEYIKENDVEYLFIAGDLYENEHIRITTIEYINNLFKEIPNTKIYITPGNHDPYTINSMYKTFKWNSNVKIFTSNIEIVNDEDVDIYGFGFNDFYCKKSDIENIQIKNNNKLNILIAHGTIVNGNIENLDYNPLNINKLEKLGFDYIALGHIHKTNYNANEEKRIIYPGSTISLGFDELGKHGIILGEISKESINLKFLPMDTKEFIENKIDVTEMFSLEELIEKINNIKVTENEFCKIVLIGKRKFEINEYELYEFVSNKNIIKIKNETEIDIAIDKISTENNLRGIFIKTILQDKQNGVIDEVTAKKIIEIGINALK